MPTDKSQAIPATEIPPTATELTDAELGAAAGGTDGTSEMGTLRMQQYMDRLAKAQTAVSNVLKAQSDSSTNTIDNLK